MKQLFIFLFSALYTLTLISQTHYSCDFEDDTENSRWNLNVTANPNLSFADEWYINTAINNGGQKSLYISSDKGYTPSYGSGSMMVAARSLTLDAGNYELSFDWLAGVSNGEDALYVAWVPEDVETNSSQIPSRPSYLDTYSLIPYSTDQSLTDSLKSSAWNSSMFKFISDGTPHKLVFVWINQPNVSSLKGACVDNIEIMPEGSCDSPYDLTLTTSGNTVILSWSGNADYYEAKCYFYATNSWIYMNNITDNDVTFHGMQEGLHSFYVRSFCGTEYSHWKSEYLLVYFSDMRCIDYLTLTNNNCWIGSATASNGGRGTRQKVDYGSDSKLSRHTIHMMEGEYDGNTGNQLPTIPPGELASVRLGNWNIGGQAECIEYSFEVNAESAAVLMLKYAVILNEPTKSHEHGQSQFEIQVLSGNKVINCAQASFSANYDTSGDPTWHAIPKSNETIWWKEWTTIGMNLKDYDGEILTIRVSTYDCTAGGHYGYAYFTMGCSDGKMDGIACGGAPTTEFIAPDGFNYRWYLPEDPDKTLGTDQTFSVDPADTLVYNCDVIFPKDPDCYFTLNASALPRYPVAEFNYNISSGNCSNIVSFENLSHIMTVNQITMDSTHTALPCETALWDFGDGFTSAEYNPTHEFPNEGGTYYVNLKVGISNNDCISDTTITLAFPALGTTFDTIPLAGCLGKPYYLPNNNMVWGDGLYTDTLSSMYGCDSIVVYDLKFYEKISVDIYDTICSGEPYIFDNINLTQSGTYTCEGISYYGCDSITTLHLLVNESLQVELLSTPVVCADDEEIELQYNVYEGSVDFYDIIFDDNLFTGLENIHYANEYPIRIPIPQSVIPAEYPGNLIFYNVDCGNDTLPFTISVLYPSSIISQRWNEVLFVQNSSYNGGYDFDHYQWYRNGEAIQGATGSYLHTVLDTQSEYSVLLTRVGEQQGVFTCAVVPYTVESVSLTLVSNVVVEGHHLQLQSSEGGRATLYNLSGVQVREYPLSEGINQLEAPSQAGYYLLRVSISSQQKYYHIHVVK